MRELIIEPGRSERQYVRDLWRYRELFYFLAWRDILVRYKQTVVGVTWTIIRPLLTLLVLTFVFGRLAQMPSGGSPYALLVFCGMLPWQFFATAITECGNSLIANSALISKVYFPRLTVPASSVVTSLLDLLISGMLVIGLFVWYGYLPSPRIVLMPVVVGLSLLPAFGVGLWVAALMVQYRDFRFIIPFLVQFGLYLSPVGFSSEVVPARWRLLYSLNPMVGVIDAFRWVVLREAPPLYWPGFGASIVVGALLFASGIWYFRRTERTFADVI